MANNQGAAETIVRDMLASAGVTANGSAPTDIQVRNPAFYPRFLRYASLGLSESYMDEWWEVEDLTGLIDKLVRARLRERFKGNLKLTLLTLKALLTNMQSVTRADEVAKKHYDIGNELFQPMLGPSMAYTCGYWRNATTLDQAQEHKFDLVCRKLGLEKGMRLLDLGCGWGGLSAFATRNYGVTAVAIAISTEQITLARELWKGLPVEFILGDYRSITGTYDAVASIGLLEHVGYKNYRTFMQVVQRSLKPEGVAVLHCCGQNTSNTHADPFVHKYIFPNGLSPSLAQIGKALEGIFVVEDMHNIGPDYAPTLKAWWANFERAWPGLRGTRYDDRFYRMWKFWLLASVALSQSRDCQLYQFQVTHTGRRQPCNRVG